jgi:TRAP-type C4-dicarboxylate transport system substrate-binding protein
LLVRRFAEGTLSAKQPALERVAAGEVQAYVASFDELTRFVPALSALAAPLLFDGLDELHKRRMPAVSKAIADALEERGVVLVGLAPCETRVLASSSALPTTKLDRLRVREPASPASRAFYKALGSPIESSAEVAELADVTLEELVATRQTRWARHVALIDHAVECGAAVLSQRWLEGLPEAMRKELRPPPAAALGQARKSAAALRSALIASLERMGIEVATSAPRQRRALAEAARAATQALVREHGAVAARIVAAARR